jgi:hypothetical protein
MQTLCEEEWHQGVWNVGLISANFVFLHFIWLQS